MKKCLVIGGGFAGLSAAVLLSENNFDITIIEASPKLGGRAYSFFNAEKNNLIDNGQHIMMGCYHETLSFLEKINAAHLIDIQESLSIPFVKKNGKECLLNIPKYFYPFNLLYGILNFRVLSLKSRLKIIDFFLDLLCCWSCDLKDKTVEQWLKEKNQTDESIKTFWQVICVGALNSKIETAAACIFADVLKQIFFYGTDSTKIILPKVSLSELYVEKTVNFLSTKNCQIKKSERVLQFELDNSKISKVVTDKSTYNFDYIISTVPTYALKKLLSESAIESVNLPNFKYSPILNAHLWLSKNPFDKKFYALIGSKIHWLFNHNKYISITISAADDFLMLKKNEILEILYSELEIFFSIFKRELVTESIIINEKRATFVPNQHSVLQRKEIQHKIENLIIAGDWIDTELPATIESAVCSGKIAVENLLRSCS